MYLSDVSRSGEEMGDEMHVGTDWGDGDTEMVVRVGRRRARYIRPPDTATSSR